MRARGHRPAPVQPDPGAPAFRCQTCGDRVAYVMGRYLGHGPRGGVVWGYGYWRHRPA